LYLLATSACTLATPALAKAGAQDCAGLGAFPVMGGHVTQVRFSAAEPALAGNGKADHPARPENCVVSGTINPRQGIDGRTYGIRFELRLPTLWRGRFYYGGGGGVDGFLPAADGTYPSGDGQHSALGDGMAVVVTDPATRSMPPAPMARSCSAPIHRPATNMATSSCRSSPMPPSA
jgi:feruloyl esterase